MLIDFFKKYWINILLFLILILLGFWIIPQQEKNYLDTDLNLLKNGATKILIITEITAVIVILIIAVKKTGNYKGIFALAGGLLFFAFSIFFALKPVFVSASLFINQFSQTNKIEKTYTVNYIDKDKGILTLWDDSIKTAIWAKELIPVNGPLNLKPQDQVTLSFKTGLLGFNFDPQLTIK